MDWITVIGFSLVGLLFVGVSIPLILGRVPRNTNYGFRVRKTIESPDIWYKVNEFSGKLMAIAGAVTTLASIGLGMLRMSDLAYNISMLVVTTEGMGIAIIASLMYVKTL